MTLNQVSQAQFGIIPLHLIETDLNQPRRTFDENAIEDLKKTAWDLQRKLQKRGAE